MSLSLVFSYDVVLILLILLALAIDNNARLRNMHAVLVTENCFSIVA